jgi:hypothetical protein
MRLLIYLLAMMTGFSAAEAARPVSATPAALGSAVAHGAVVVASVTAVQQGNAPAFQANIVSLTSVMVAPADTIQPALATSPVTRHDISRQ